MRLVAAVFIVICSLFAGVTHAGSIRWLENIDAGRAEAQQSGKLLLVHFWSTHCGPCVQLERNVYSQAEVAEAISQHFVAVKINTETHPELARRHGIRFVPTDMVIDPSGRLLATQKCPPQATRYLAGLLRLLPTAGPSADSNSIPQTPIAMSMPVTYGNPEYSAPAVGPRYANLASPASNGTSPPAMTPELAPPSNPPVVKRPVAPWETAAKSGDNVGAAGVTGLSTVRNNPPSSSISQSSYLPSETVPSPTRSTSVNLPTVPPALPLPPTIDAPSLDGMCPVELVEHKKWVAGQTQWGAYHRGRLYLFSGEHQQQRFLANPDYYSPVLSGYDPVVAAESHAFVLGHRKHGVFYKNRVYLFADEENLKRFYQSPDRFQAASTRP
ncbi:MAG: thioredoxin family protein [Planctomycetota bacterium]|nr:thioredoxin family protein [Planctomycetota bacterium]